MTFIGIPPANMVDPTTEHINGNRQDNNIKNLEWMERVENASTRKHTGKGETNSKAKLKESQVREICELLSKGNVRTTEIAKMYDVNPSCIRSIKRRQNWTFISEQYDY